jgi:hypothetical protein
MAMSECRLQPSKIPKQRGRTFICESVADNGCPQTLISQMVCAHASHECVLATAGNTATDMMGYSTGDEG